jgi:hypothetical protein
MIFRTVKEQFAEMALYNLYEPMEVHTLLMMKHVMMETR